MQRHLLYVQAPDATEEEVLEQLDSQVCDASSITTTPQATARAAVQLIKLPSTGTQAARIPLQGTASIPVPPPLEGSNTAGQPATTP